MSIQLPQGFNIRSIEPIDKRIVLTKAEMCNVNENVMPGNYYCICKDDSKFYIWNKTFDKLETTGRFRSYEEIINMAEALTKAMSTPEGAQQIANALFDTDQFRINTDKRVELAIQSIQAIDGDH